MAVNYFTPVAIGWETTLACNMRCKHCGSIAGFKRTVELDTDQALDLCAQFDAFPNAHITLTGGETFVRKDWPKIVEDLIRRRGSVGIISNAWYIDKELVTELKELQGSEGVINLGLSLDGDEERHDNIRRPDSYNRVLDGMDNLRDAGIPFSVITTLNPTNILTIDHIADVVRERGAYAWQIQITSEYGRAAEDGSLVLNRSLYRDVVEKTAHYRKQFEGTECIVYTADCLGYWGPLERDLRTRPWHGCHAGIRCLGIQSNGNVKGCLSLLEDIFIEGNCAETPLIDIWNKQGAFAFNREFEPEKLRGACARCKYGYICRAGCHSTAYSILGTVDQAPYCVYAEDQGWLDTKTNVHDGSKRLLTGT